MQLDPPGRRLRSRASSKKIISQPGSIASPTSGVAEARNFALAAQNGTETVSERCRARNSAALFRLGATKCKSKRGSLARIKPWLLWEHCPCPRPTCCCSKSNPRSGFRPEASTPIGARTFLSAATLEGLAGPGLCCDPKRHLLASNARFSGGGLQRFLRERVSRPTLPILIGVDKNR